MTLCGYNGQTNKNYEVVAKITIQDGKNCNELDNLYQPKWYFLLVCPLTVSS